MQELAGLGGNVQFCKMEVQTEVYQQIFSEFVRHTHTHACMHTYTYTRTHTVHTSMKLYMHVQTCDRQGRQYMWCSPHLPRYILVHLHYTYTYSIQYTAYSIHIFALACCPFVQVASGSLWKRFFDRSLIVPVPPPPPR